MGPFYPKKLLNFDRSETARSRSFLHSMGFFFGAARGGRCFFLECQKHHPQQSISVNHRIWWFSGCSPSKMLGKWGGHTRAIAVLLMMMNAIKGKRLLGLWKRITSGTQHTLERNCAFFFTTWSHLIKYPGNKILFECVLRTFVQVRAQNSKGLAVRQNQSCAKNMTVDSQQKTKD